MVQFFTSSPSPRAMQQGEIGKALGIGLAKNFPDPQQMVQKRMLSEAFQKFRNEANPNASPLDLTMSFLEATAGIPGSERYVGQVLPLLLRQSEGNRGASLQNPDGSVPPQPQPNQNQNPPPTVQNQPQKFTPNNATQFLQQTAQEIPNFPQPDTEQQNLFEGSLEPTMFGMGNLPNTYSPQQIKQLQEEDLRAGFADMPRAKRAEEYNELSRKHLQDYTQAAQTQSAISQKRRQGQQEFRTVLESFVGKNSDDLALAESIAENKYPNISNDQIRAEKVSREFDLLKGNLNEFRNNSSRPNPYMPWSKEKYKTSFENLRKNSQPLIDMGMRPQINKMLADNGWSRVETDQILNPLGEKIISEVKGLPSLEEKNPLDYAKLASGFSETKKAYEGENKRLENNKKIWSDYFKKTIKPGEENPRTMDTLKPGTSLMLLQNQFMKKNGGYLDFQKIINDLVSKGEIKLDKYQQKEMNTLNDYPINNYTIEEFFFGTKNL